jgi:hypothetical protein
VPITLQFIQGENVFDKAIMAYSHGWATHVDAVMPDERLLGSQSHVIGGIPEGVQIRPPKYEPFAKIIRVTLPASPQQEKVFWNFLNAQLGKPYDYAAIFGMAFGRDWHRDGSWFCSELAGVGLENCGVFPNGLAETTSTLTPPGLLLACSVLTKVEGV